MLTPSEIFKIFSPFIGIPKQGNIIYQNKKIHIKDNGILIFDMDLGDTEDIYFPATIFNIILKAKAPTFKRKNDILVVESKLPNGKKKDTSFNYFKLDHNYIQIQSPDTYDILYTIPQDELSMLSQLNGFIQKDDKNNFAGIFKVNNENYFASGSRTFSYISKFSNQYPELNMLKNFIFPSIEEGEIKICKEKDTNKLFYKIDGENFNCVLPLPTHRLTPTNIISKYPIFNDLNNFYKIEFSATDIQTALKEITSDIGKTNIKNLEFEVEEEQLILSMQNTERVSSKVEVTCKSEEKFYIKIESPIEKEILSAFALYKGNISFLIPKSPSIGKICIIDGDIKFVCTYNELRN